MAYIQDINVNIIKGTMALAQKGFGLPLILGASEETNLQGQCKQYASVAEVVEDYAAGSAEYAMAGAMFSQEPSPKTVLIYARTKDSGGVISGTITAALDDALEKNPAFYAVFIPERTKTDLYEAGTWASDNKKFFFGCTDDITALTGRNNEREAFLIHDKPDSYTITIDGQSTVFYTYPECAWAGQNLPKDPGSITWKWKSLNNQIAANFTSTELGTIREDKGQTITEIGGVPVVNEGITTKGEYIDVIRGQDWVKARIEEGLYQLFISNDKIPMDNTGIAQVEGVVRSVLKQAGNMGIIARATTEAELANSDDKEYMYKVTVPKREDLSMNDRAARKLSGVHFVYWLAGAIHEAQVQGKITV